MTRVTIAFTGLASYNDFTTQDWLRDTLFEIGTSTHKLAGILQVFQTKASDKFAQLSRAIGKPQRIAFLVSGFLFSPDAENVCDLISNFHFDAQLSPADKLDLQALGSKGTPTVEAVGCTIAFTKQDREALLRMLGAGNAPPRVLRKAVQTVRRYRWTGNREASLVRQCNSGVIPQIADTPIVATYHSVKPTFRAFGPDVVLAITNCGAAVAGTLLRRRISFRAGNQKVRTLLVRLRQTLRCMPLQKIR